MDYYRYLPLIWVLITIYISGAQTQKVIEESDAIVVEAADVLTRNKRQAPVGRQTWGDVLGEGITCLTTKGILGSCTSFRHCYPYYKLPNTNIWDSWVLGNHDTCSYFDQNGRQEFGVCCTNPAAMIPDDSANNQVVEEASQQVQADGQINENRYQFWPPQVGSWPPPIPTHPPDHTPATHPTAFPTLPPPATTVVTRPPSYPWQSTTHRPTYPTSTTTESSEPSNGFQHATCGSKNGVLDQERIVGGQNAVANEWPWVVVLFNGGRQFCGGSLIDDVHVLTAAHCIAHMSSWDVARLKAHLGDHNIRTNYEVQHVERKIKRIVRHRGFDSRTLYNDIAILTLDQPVQFTKNVRPICLPSGGSKAYNGLKATVAGWGSLREMGPQPSTLQKVTIPIWSNDQCKAKYGSAAPGGIIPSMMCAGESTRDSCSGDSGGPLMLNDGRWTQVGIVSWGIGCGKGQYPGVYTRVTSFLPWITKNLHTK